MTPSDLTTTSDPATSATSATPAATPSCNVSADLERALTQVARAILRLAVPRHVLAEGESIDRAGYWLLVRISGQSPIRLSELADSVDLDLSTVSRQIRDLVASGLVTKEHDPGDGRAWLLNLSDRGASVLRAVSDARRQVLAEAVADWTEVERDGLAAGLLRLEAGLHHQARDPQTEQGAS